MTSTLTLPQYYVILDFEATCDGDIPPKPQEIIEFPSVIVDSKTNTIISEFQRYVKPIHHPKLTKFCTELTGITQNQVDKGCSIEEAIKEYNTWLAENGLIGDNFIIVTCGNWDLQIMFPRQCKTSNLELSYPFKKWINIKEVFGKFYNIPKVGGMTRMLEHLSLQLEGRHHSGIDDCRNIARIWMTMYKEGFRPDEKDCHYVKRLPKT